MVIIGILSGMGIAQFNSSIKKARLAKAQSAAAQFTKQAMAANALMNDKLFTAWYPIEESDFKADEPNKGTLLGQLKDKSSNKYNLARSGAHLTIDIDTGKGNGTALKTISSPVLNNNTPPRAKPNKITFAAWIKNNSTNSTYPMHIAESAGIGVNKEFIRFYASSNISENISKSIKNGKWYFVVGSYDGETARLWIDGELIGTKKYASRSFTKGLRIGYSRFDGSVDEVMFIHYGYDGEKFY